MKTPSHRERLRVLIVDDDSVLLFTARHYLEPTCDVVTALGGRMACGILTWDTNFDVILCDIVMPDLNGPSVYAFVRLRFPELEPRVLFWTSGIQGGPEASFVHRHAHRVLGKPVTGDDLNRAIQAVAEGTMPALPRRRNGG